MSVDVVCRAMLLTVLFSALLPGWIASKVKAVAPALPTASPTVVVPAANDGLPRAPGASIALSSAEKQSTGRPGGGKKKKKKKTTVSLNVAGSTAAPDTDNDVESAKRVAGSKSVKKRFVRAFGH